MSINRKVKLVQALYGAIALTLMMQPMGMLGYGGYIWMLFMPLLLFFAFGAEFKVIPSMIVCYVCGVAWALVNGILSGVLGGFLSAGVVSFAAPIIVIFAILTVHENFLQKSIFGNVPALFMGLASTFFTFLIKPENAPAITPVHLVGFFLYGILLSVVLAGGGFLVCSLIFGKEKTTAVFEGKES
jgi:hypothetical protein